MAKQLADRVWETRRARIKLERRLLAYAKIFEWIVPWYSFVLIAVSMVPWAQGRGTAQILTAAGAVFILVLSVIGSSQQYRLRAERVKDQYIDLDRIYRDLSGAKESDDRRRLEAEYDERLRTTENHSEYDYLSVKIDCRAMEGCTVAKPRATEWIAYLVRRGGFYVSMLVLFVGGPALCVLLLK